MLKEDFARKEMSDIVKNTLNGELGEKFMKVMSIICLADVSVKGTDPHMTYYNIGKRDVYLQLKALFEYENNLNQRNEEYANK